MLSSNMAIGLCRMTWISRAVTRTMHVCDYHGLEPRMEKFMEKPLCTIKHKAACILISFAIKAAMLEDSMTLYKKKMRFLINEEVAAFLLS